MKDIHIMSMGRDGFVKKIAILGSTGSIGTQTLEIVRDNPDLQVDRKSVV